MARKKPVGRNWQPFREMGRVPLNLPDSMQVLLKDEHEWRLYQNNLYTVLAKMEQSGMVTEDHPDGVPILHLSIRRNDRKTMRSWRDLHRIKSEIAGAEVEAVEIFPAESRLLDGANQYHLYCLPPGMQFPFGEWTRSVAGPEDFAALARAHGATEEQIAGMKGKQEAFEWDPDVTLNAPGMFDGFSDLDPRSARERMEDENEEGVAREVYVGRGIETEDGIKD